jgi:hypothetical protein
MSFLSVPRIHHFFLFAIAVLLISLQSLVGAGIAGSAISHNGADSSSKACTELQDRVVKSSAPPLLIKRQRLRSEAGDAGGSSITDVVSLVDVSTNDLFAAPPDSPLIVANPPYPYHFKKACWGSEELTFSQKPDSDLTAIAMPSPDRMRSLKIGPWNRSNTLVAQALPPVAVLGDPSKLGIPFNPGASVDITLNTPDVPTPPGTPLDSKFNWTLETIPDIGDSNPPLLSVKTGRSTKLTFPTEIKPAEKIIINYAFDNQNLGEIVFKRVNGESKWQLEPSTTETSSLLFMRPNLYISSRTFSLVLAIACAVFAYVAISVCIYWFNSGTDESLNILTNWKQLNASGLSRILTYLNPVVMTSGAYGKASLSRLQLLWFTIIVMSVLVYLFSLTGDLSDLPGSVLGLLGVSATGTVATTIAGNSTNRLSFANWQWLNEQGWLTEANKYGGPGDKKGLVVKFGNNSRLRDLLLDENGVVNVYKFQLLFASFLVGVFLILSGGSNLRGFRLPENFPQLLGISNMFYVFGRFVQPTGFDDLNEKIKLLITKESELKSSASANPGQRPTCLDGYLLDARLAAGMTKVVFSDLADTKFDDMLSIADDELLPMWAQVYGNDWLRSS